MMEWLNEPPQWAASETQIRMICAPQTDFWRKTWDGGIRDSGHCFGQWIEGDFDASVDLSGEYSALYDQSGLMIRQDETTWLKCGIEQFDGRPHAAAVVTRDTSDYSLEPLPAGVTSLRVRVTRRGGTLEVHIAVNDEPFRMIRQAWLSDARHFFVGVMACAPTGQGFAATFENFRVRPA